MQIPIIAWILIIFTGLIIEFLTVSFFAITISIGAIAGLTASLVTTNMYMQLVVFLASTIIAFISLRPIMVNLFPVKEETATAADRLIGRRAIAMTKIDNIEGSGQVKCEGEVWKAASASGEKIEEREVVKIAKIDGVKAIVQRIEFEK